MEREKKKKIYIYIYIVELDSRFFLYWRLLGPLQLTSRGLVVMYLIFVVDISEYNNLCIY